MFGITPIWLGNATRYFRNLFFDLRYGGLAGGYIRNRFPEATGVSSTDYWTMDQIFNGRVGKNDVLVDVGCGKGRVINWWLSRGYGKKIIGIELMPEIAAATQRRLARFPHVTILQGNAVDLLPEEGTVFYLFNPFSDADTMQAFKGRMSELCLANPNRVVIYWAPTHVAVFEADGDWTVEHVEITLPRAGHFEDRHRHLALMRYRG